MPCRWSVLNPVDEPLGMLDPEPDGQGLGLHGHACKVQHPVRVPGAVPGGQEEKRTIDFFSPVNNRPFQLVL